MKACRTLDVASVQFQVAAALPPVDGRRYQALRGLCVLQGRLKRAAEEKNTLLLPEIRNRTINLHLDPRD
jgi:hypothetical protein